MKNYILNEHIFKCAIYYNIYRFQNLFKEGICIAIIIPFIKIKKYSQYRQSHRLCILKRQNGVLMGTRFPQLYVQMERESEIVGE